MMVDFTYHRAETVAELVQHLAADPEGTRLLAGGTDLLVFMMDRKLRPRTLIDAKRVPGLNELRVNCEASIGPLVSMRRMERDATLRASYTALAEGAAEVGGVAIRNRATLGGNLGTASPAADAPPALLVLGAVLEVVGPRDRREVPIAEFFLAPGLSCLREGEIIESIRLPAPAERSGSSYLKLATRQAMDIAFVGVAARVDLAADGTVADAAVGLGAVAPTPRLVPELSEALAGRVLDEAALNDAAAVAMAASSPITDQRCSAEYRRAMVGELTRRALRRAAARAEGGR